MKYGYKGAESSELIRCYESTANGKIIITFLDGSNFEIPLTEDNINELRKEMLEQAQKRSKAVSLDMLRTKRTQTLVELMILSGMSVSSSTFPLYDDSVGVRVVSGILSGIAAVTAVVCGVEYKFRNDEIKELEKYDIYLSIRERLETINDPNLFNGIKQHEGPLNINTLDNYSLSEIKTIRDNLKRFEKYSSYFEKTGSYPTLTRKIGK